MFGVRILSSIPSRCIGCQACVNACAECETHRGMSMIHFDFIDRANTIATVADGLHALRRSDLRAGLPGRRHQEDAGRRRADRRSSRAASPARIACSPARSAFRR